MGNEYFHNLGTSCFAFSMAIVLILAVRSTLRKVFGASTAYLVWLAVPMAAITPFLPRSQIQVWSFIPVAPMELANAATHEVASQSDIAPLLLIGLWITGVVLTCLIFIVQHVRFSRANGAVEPSRTFVKSLKQSKNNTGPFLLGLWHPIIVVPSDFRQRYSARERSLILEHERAHMKRLDPIANTLCAVLQCLFWFNPLAHIAAYKFRFDQELGCDEIVMRRYPGRCRSYAEAILKTQTGSRPSPLACQWQFIHPLKVRIMQLERSIESNARRTFGRSLIAAIVATLAFGAWTVQAGESPGGSGPQNQSSQLYEIALVVKAGGETINPRLRTKAGMPATIEFGTAPNIWTISVDLTPREGKQVASKLDIQYAKKLVASPKLIHALDESAGVRIGAEAAHPDLDLKLTVKEWKVPS